MRGDAQARRRLVRWSNALASDEQQPSRRAPGPQLLPWIAEASARHLGAREASQLERLEKLRVPRPVVLLSLRRGSGRAGLGRSRS